MVKHITIETVQELYFITTPKSIGIADLGCSSGSNTLSTIKDIIEAVQGISLKMMQLTPEFRVYLNDLPTNDFNSIFKSLPDFSKQFKKDKNDRGCPSSIFIGGYPGSFYGRLFPNSCLHFVYSSYSLHWLSRVKFFVILSFLDFLCYCVLLKACLIITIKPYSIISCRFLQDYTTSRASL